MADDGLIVDNGGKIIKMEVDYSSTCDEKIPICEQLAKGGTLKDALDILLQLEKQTRTGADAHSTTRVLLAIVRLCFEAKDWNSLLEHIVILSKRRSQIKMATTKMVQECCSYLDQIEDRDTMLKLLDTLLTVTAGKMYIEIERARLTHRLAKIKEAEGNIVEAATILQELQVETFGSMDRKEKVELILEQMRLCLARKDFIRTQIISKKINTKFFTEDDTEELKLKFYRLMIELDQHEASYLAISKHFKAILDTPSIQKNESDKNEALKCVLLYLILAPYDNEQSDMMHRVKLDKSLEAVPKFKELITLFTTSELIKHTALVQLYEKDIRNADTSLLSNHVFSPTTEDGVKRWSDLKSRVVEHNIRVMAKYYTKIRLPRIAHLLDLNPDEAEESLCNLVVSGMVQAKTDRPSGIVSFRRPQDPSELLNDWSKNIGTLMQLVNKTTHLINREEMVYENMRANSAMVQD